MPPIIAIHGGPGWPHNYLVLPLQQQACRGRAVYFYDQAGCGESALPGDNASVAEDYPWLLITEYYAEKELPTLIDHWGLEQYHIMEIRVGGTILTQVFAAAVDTPATELQSMVLSGPRVTRNCILLRSGLKKTVRLEACRRLYKSASSG
jgi:proline iminopeptidase